MRESLREGDSMRESLRETLIEGGVNCLRVGGVN